MAGIIISGGGGTKGEKGEKGDTGQRGTKWFIGHGLPDSIVGSSIDDLYLDVDTGEVYELEE